MKESVYYLKLRISVINLVHFDIPSITDLQLSGPILFYLFRFDIKIIRNKMLI